jgi:hypothetical protein
MLHGAAGIGGLLLMGEAENNCLPGYDGNGNVAVLVKTSTGTVAAAYEYSPFGETLAENGEYAEHNPFRFSTKYAEAHSNLIYYGHRYIALRLAAGNQETRSRTKVAPIFTASWPTIQSKMQLD